MANATDQAVTWTNRKAGDYQPLWAATVTPWTLEQPWVWEVVPDDTDNVAQNEQN